MNELFKAKKLSLNTKSQCIPYTMKVLKKITCPWFSNTKNRQYRTKRKVSMKFLEVLLDENLTWKGHTKAIENKISKSIGLISRAKNVLNKDSLTKLYYYYINCYLNYANMASGSSHKSKCYKIHLK